MDIRLYAFFPYKAQFEFAQETYDCSVIFLLTGGQFSYQLNGQHENTLHAGEFVIFPPKATVHRRVIEPITLHMLKFEQPPFATDRLLRSTITLRISDNLDRLASFGFCEGYLPDEVAHWSADIMFEIAYELQRTPTDGFDIHTVLRALLREIEQYPAESYPNDVLCSRMCCCETRLIQLFRKETKQTPQQYLQTTRLQHSRVLLIQTNDSIQSIANQCGFSDSLYFSRLFSRRYGQSPRQFRIQNHL